MPGEVGNPLSLYDLIQQGWYATYPLILFSVFMVGIVLDRFWTLSRLVGASERLTNDVVGHLQKGDLGSATNLVDSQKGSSPASRVYAALMPLITRCRLEEILEFGERRRLDENRALRRNIWVLGTICASAPFIGLLGTVVGIIKSFHQMAVLGTGGFSVVAAGISEALVATALGLAVAILAVIFFNILQVKVGNLDSMLRAGLGRVMEAAELGGVHGPR
jgi:biopolymer transport protein ExbB